MTKVNLIRLAFSKMPQIRNVALLEFKHLLDTLQKTSGVPKGFWSDPYIGGFFMGYTMGVGVHISGGAIKRTDASAALVDAIFELVPHRASRVSQQYREWEASREPSFDEGENNGTLFALYCYKAARLDDNPIILEAQLKADSLAPMWEKLNRNPDEHSRVTSALRRMLFWDKIRTPTVDANQVHF
jgi:hypothetical protein